MNEIIHTMIWSRMSEPLLFTVMKDEKLLFNIEKFSFSSITWVFFETLKIDEFWKYACCKSKLDINVR